MDTGIVYYRRDGPDVLKMLLQKQAGRLVYVIQERLEDIQFVQMKDWPVGDFWPRGRAFGPEIEVRWREVALGMYDLLVLSEKDEGLKDGWGRETYEVRTTYAENRLLKIYLWGTYKEEQGVWIETRIPRELKYPLDSPQEFAYLEVAEYSQDGVVRFTRFRGLNTEEMDVSMRAEWYDFVPLSKEKRCAPDAKALTHASHVPERYSGYLDLALVAESPVHIGSGSYELSEDAGLPEDTVVKGISRVAGKPVIPSSSLKGALRSIYETITYSCVGRLRESSREKYCRDTEKSELPQPLIDKMPPELQKQADVPVINVQLNKRELDGVKRCELKKGERNLDALCPACALFGVENFQGRVSFDDAGITELPEEPKQHVQLPSMYGPRLHRLGEPMVVTEKGRTFIRVHNLKGRKAYYRVHLGDVPAEGQILVDYLPKSTRLKTRLHFRNVILAELGGLLTALGLDPEHPFPFRVGGGKPVGLGYIAFELQGIHALNSQAAFTQFDSAATKELAVNACLKAFQQSEGTLLYRQGLEKLCEIMARPYVPDEEGNT